MNITKEQLERIRIEASSQAINKTIRLVSEELNITFPQLGTPTENRAAMVDVLRIRLR